MTMKTNLTRSQCECIDVESNRSPTDDIVGRIHSVETCGAVDGPGLRYVLFLSGCPLRCRYCHNPEAQGPPKGRMQTVAETIEDILRYRAFLRSGGVTISGGEPLMQADFVEEVFRRSRREGLHTALDTSGFLGDRVSDDLLAETDLVLLDIKGIDEAKYRDLTGVSLAPTLRLARRLDAMGKTMWIRFVLVPGLTDDASTIAGIAALVASMNHVERVEILPFHKLGEHKYQSIQKPYLLSETPEPTKQQVDQCRAIFADHGVATH